MLKRDRSYGQARVLLPKLGMLTMHPEVQTAVIGTVKPSNWDAVMTPTFLPPSKDWV